MIVRLAASAMATRFELVLEGADEARSRAIGEAALAEVEECEGRLSRFARSSLVSLLDREAGRRAVRVDGDSFELLQRCAELWIETAGAFDATLGRRMEELGFHPAHERVPDASSARGSGCGFELDQARCTFRFTRPGLALDLGGIAKGHALERAAEVLRAQGVERALLHGGTSSVLAIGAPPGEAGWRVAIGREPQAPIALLCDGALSVSTRRGRVVRGPEGERTHVLDPSTGEPARGPELAAVIHASAREADALSTALLVGGLPLARRLGLCALLLSSDADGARAWSRVGEAAGASRFELSHAPSPTFARGPA